MKLIEKIKDFFGFKLPSMEITSERRVEIIEKIVDTISKYDMLFPSSIVVAGLIPTSTIISQTAFLPFAPFLELLGINGYEYAAFLGNKENVERLHVRIEQIRQQKEHKWVW